jgi:hypothetical protein
MSVENDAEAFAKERVNFLIDNNYIDKNRREELFETLKYKFIEEDATDRDTQPNNSGSKKS